MKVVSGQRIVTALLAVFGIAGALSSIAFLLAAAHTGDRLQEAGTKEVREWIAIAATFCGGAFGAVGAYLVARWQFHATVRHSEAEMTARAIEVMVHAKEALELVPHAAFAEGQQRPHTFVTSALISEILTDADRVLLRRYRPGRNVMVHLAIATARAMDFEITARKQSFKISDSPDLISAMEVLDKIVESTIPQIENALQEMRALKTER